MTLLAAALRIFRLGHKSLWYDEALYYHIAQGPWSDVIKSNASSGSAPPLFPLLLALISGPDASEAWLRAPSMIAGVMSVPLIWLLAREFTDKRYAILSALLVAVAPTLIEYSQELREYSITFCLTVVILFVYLRFLKHPTTGTMVAMAFAVAASIFLQYGFVLLVAALNVLVLMHFVRSRPYPRRAMAGWAIAQLPGMLTMILVYFIALKDQLALAKMVKLGYLADGYWDGSATGFFALFVGGPISLIDFSFPRPLLLFLVIAGLASMFMREAPKWLMPFLAAPLAITFVGALAGIYPFGGLRQDIFLLPMIYVLAAAGFAILCGLSGKRFGRHASNALYFGLLALVTVHGLATSLPRLSDPGNEPIKLVLPALKSGYRPNDRIYVHFGAQQAFGYYWRKRSEPWIAGSVHAPGWGGPELARSQIPAIQTELRASVPESGYLWVVFSHIPPADIDALAAPLRNDHQVEVVSESKWVRLYRVKRE